jgi:dTDP-4-dehydrorhamnose 3,5-epimerase
VKVIQTALPDVLLVEPQLFSDARGFFFESYHAARYAEAGLPDQFVQDNHARSLYGTLRGLHYQLRTPQGKLVRAIMGSIFDVAVDIRRGSPTFGCWVSAVLSAENKRQLYVPPGFAHGYYATDAIAEVEYKCTEFYRAEDRHGIRWDDPTLAIAWPGMDPILSDNDKAFGFLSSDRSDLPEYKP